MRMISHVRVCSSTTIHILLVVEFGKNSDKITRSQATRSQYMLPTTNRPRMPSWLVKKTTSLSRHLANTWI